MAQDKRDQLYDNLIGSGKVTEKEIGNKEEFKNAIKDENSSRQFYKNLMDSGTFSENDLGTEDDFYNSISPDFSAPAPQVYKPTPEEMAGFNSTVRSAQRFAGQVVPRYDKKAKRAQQRAGFRVPNRINVGETNNLQEEQHLNPETGELEKSYITSGLNEYENKAQAEQEQQTIEQYKRDQQYKQSVPGQLEMAYQERDRINKMLAERREQIMKDNGNKSFLTRLLEEFGRASRSDKLPEETAIWKDFDNDREYNSLMAAARKNRAIITALEDQKNQETDSFWHSLATDITNGYNLSVGGKSTAEDIAARADAALMLDDINKKRENGEKLTREEEVAEAVLKNNAWDQQVQAKYGDSYGAWARAGKMTATSLDLMFDLMAMGGNPMSLAKDIYAGVTKWGAEKLGEMATKGLGKYMMKALGATLGSMVAGAEVTNTIQLPKTLGNTLKNVQGDVYLDDKGNYVFGHYEDDENGEPVFVEGGESFLGSFLDAERQGISENASEIAGTFLEGAGPLILKGLEKVGLSKIANKITALTGKSWYKTYSEALKTMGFNGIPGEALEEYTGDIFSLIMGDPTGIVGDKEGRGGWADLDKHIDIWLGCATMGGLLNAPRMVGTGYSTAQYYRYKHAAEKASEAAASVFDSEEWQLLQEAIDGANNEQMKNVALSIRTDDKLNDEQKISALKYIQSVQAMRGYNLGRIAAEREGDDNPALQQADHSYAEGYNSSEPQDMNDAKNQLETSKFWLKEMVTDELMAEFEQNPIEALRSIINNEEWTPEEKQTAIDYVNARMKYDGMLDGVRDDIEGKIEISNATIDKRTNPTDGMLHHATTQNDEDVYIIGGTVVMDESGQNVDVEASRQATGGDNMILGIDTATGKVKSYDISDFATIDQPVEANQMKAEAAENIRQTTAQEAADKIDGKLTFQPNDQYQILDEQGAEHTIQVLQDNGDGTIMATIDGAAEPIPMAMQDLQTMADAYSQAKVMQQQAELQAERNAEAASLAEDNDSEGMVEEQPAEEQQPVTALDKIPVVSNEKGEPIINKRGEKTYLWNQAPVSDTADAFTEMTDGDMVMARDTAKSMIENAKADLEKANKLKAQGKDPMAIIESRKTNAQAVKQAQDVVKYWQDVYDEMNRRMKQAEIDRKAAEEAAKTEEQRAAEAARQAEIAAKQAEIDAQRRREEVERQRKERNKPYAPLQRAKKDMAGYDEALAILDEAEPRDLSEWVSHLLRPHSLMWEDEKVGESTVTGLQSELGLQKKDFDRIGTLLGKRSEGALPFAEVVDEIHEGLPEAMKEQYTDQDVRNALIDLFGEGDVNRMLHLAEEHRIEEAQLMVNEMERRNQEAELDAWAEAYHLTPEERESFEAFMQEPPSEPEQEIINQIIAEHEQQSTGSKTVDEQSYVRTDGTENQGSQTEVQGEGAQEQSNADSTEQPAKDTEAGTGRQTVSDDNVSGGEPTAVKSVQDNLRQILTDAYASGDAKRIATAAELVRNFILNDNDGFDGVYREDIDDYTGTDPEILAEQYIIHATQNYYLDDDEDQEYIRTGLRKDLREKIASTESKPQQLGETSSPEEIAAEEAKVNTEPTEGQKKAGNYQMGHIKIDGFDVSIENPKGSIRSGVDQNGKEWSQEMHNTYGYIRRTEGVDGDHIDVFLSDYPDEGYIYVIDQVNPETGEFDEHKVMYGFDSVEEATEAYLSNYEEGWKGLGNINRVERSEFKKWVESSHRKTKPFAEYKSVKKDEYTEAGEGVQTLDALDIPAEVKDQIAEVEQTLDDILKQPAVPEDKETKKKVDKLNDKLRFARRKLATMLRTLTTKQLLELKDAYKDGGGIYTIITNEIRERQIAQQMADVYDAGIDKQQVKVSNKEQKPAKQEDYVTANEKQPALSGVYHDPDGYAVVSDGYVLLADKKAYDKAHKGETLTVGKDAGKKIEGNYPNWKLIARDNTEGYKKAKINVGNLLGFIAGVEDKLKEQWKAEKDAKQTKMSFKDWSSYAEVFVKMPDGSIISFRPQYLKLFAQGMKQIGANEVEYLNIYNKVLATSKNGVALVMPLANYDSWSDDADVHRYFYDLSEGKTKTKQSWNTNVAESFSNIPNGNTQSQTNELSLPNDWELYPTEDIDNEQMGWHLKGLKTLLSEINAKLTDPNSNYGERERRILHTQQHSLETELAMREKKFEEWRNLYGITKDNGEDRISLEGLTRLFKDLNKNKKLDKLFEKVVKVAEQIGLDITFDDFVKGSGSFNNLGQLKLNTGLLTSSGHTSEDVAKTILHELIHSVTKSTISAYKAGGEKAANLTDSQKKATRKLINEYYQLRNWAVKHGYDPEKNYWMKSPHEMVAEMSNPDFRRFLQSIQYTRKKTFWEVLKDAIHGIFSLKETGSEEGRLADMLDDLIDNFSMDTFNSMRNYKYDEVWSTTKAVEKTLMGVHNIPEYKLRKVLKQGGLANPSLAVVDTKNHIHTDYGEISLIPRSNLIDARKGRNAGTFTADAWTATYPQVLKKMPDKGWDKFYKDTRAIQKYEDGGQEMYSRIRMAWDSYLDGREPGELYWWYLLDRGYKPTVVRNQNEYGAELTDEVTGIMQDPDGNDLSLASLSDEAIKRIAELKREYDAAHGEEPVNIQERINWFKEKMEGKSDVVRNNMQKRIDELEKYGDTLANLSQWAERVLWTGKREGQVSIYDTTLQAQKEVQKNHASDYQAWLLEKEGEYGVQEKLFAGTDDYTGRQKWIPNTLANASKLMKKAGLNGAVGWSSLGEWIAKVATRLTKLEDIRKARKNLNTTKEQHDAFHEKWGNIMHQIAEKIAPGGETWSGEARMTEALEHTNPAAYIQREYGINLNKTDRAAIDKFIKEVRENFPTGYFETKFQRPVYLNEFAVAVVPETTSPEIIYALEREGLKITTYQKDQQGNPDDESRRQAVMKAVQDEDDILFRDDDDDEVEPQNDVFYSNAQRAVENVAQEKATPEQWIKMIEKQGGFKAGEDKWLGLRDWLNTAAQEGAKTINKQQILDYIKSNQIPVEEVNYREYYGFDDLPKMLQFRKEFSDLIEGYKNQLDELDKEMEDFEDKMYEKYGYGWANELNDEEQEIFDAQSEKYNSDPEYLYDQAFREMVNRYGDDFESAFEVNYNDGTIDVQEDMYGDGISGAAKYFLELNDQIINDVRLNYTTAGLDNKREIAITVPTIEPYNASDEIHFGDAGEGRAVVWVRFGDATIPIRKDVAKTVDDFEEPWDNGRGMKLYYPKGSKPGWGKDYIVYRKDVNDNYVYGVIVDGKDTGHYDTFDEAKKALNDYYQNHPESKVTGETKVLVIDEIQSKRHQDARESGYKEKLPPYTEDMLSVTLNEDGDWEIGENLENGNLRNLSYYPSKTMSKEQAIDTFIKSHDRFNPGVPQAPFEKNWHEVAMKRMLRYAAEHGYDKIAWTTGDQQADRYDIGNEVNKIISYDYPEVNDPDGRKSKKIEIRLSNGETITMRVDQNGKVIEGRSETEGKQLSDVVGKDLAKRIMEGNGKDGSIYDANKDLPAKIIEGEGLRIGAEGMKGFYDDILPRFMNKYGKKWGVKVGEVHLPDLEKGAENMWSVDITPEMRESVMEGQPLFRLDDLEMNPRTTGEDMSWEDEEDNPIFYSNALKAVEAIKQDKATPDQWLAMIQKNGGLKAGEDKWIGLTDWLNEQKDAGVKSLTKQQLMQYIRSNQIQIDETRYGDTMFSPNSMRNLESEIQKSLQNGRTVEDALRMWDKEFYGEHKLEEYQQGRFTVDENGFIHTDEESLKPIVDVRKNYTTKGLSDKKEIALTVPTIEPYNEHDTTHFGDAGGGRAVAWIRFGETPYWSEEPSVTEARQTLKSLSEKYDGQLVRNPEMTDEEKKLVNEANRTILRGEQGYKRALVIDEIQSKRHQDAREKGYISDEDQKNLDALEKKYLKAVKKHNDLERERKEIDQAIIDSEEAKALFNYDGNGSYVENAGDKLKEIYKNNKEYQNKLKETMDAYKELQEIQVEYTNEKYRLQSAIPQAPFEKNWHELAMKRMLRYAAENGYDKIAWTTGQQQAERYSLSKAVRSVRRSTSIMGPDWFTLVPQNGAQMRFHVGEDGKIDRVSAGGYGSILDHTLVDLFGKDAAAKIEALNDNESIDFENQTIGGEGMKGFYDEILPRFLNKYGKKWGVKVEKTKFPRLGYDGMTMWSIDITPEMRESVLKGQPMFRNIQEQKPQQVEKKRTAAEQRSRAAFAERQRRRAVETAKDTVKKLNLQDKVTILDNGDNLRGRYKKAKGWYDRNTGKIVIVIDNHKSPADVMMTILHEGVAHYGLRKLFGSRFDQFLKNVYEHGAFDIKVEISDMAARLKALDKKYGRTIKSPEQYQMDATEEFLAKLAEDTDFERATNQGWWQQIKQWFIDMCREVGLWDFEGELTDNELRYILWRSYKNLAEPGRYMNVFQSAEDIAMQVKLDVGNYSKEQQRIQKTGKTDTSNFGPVAAEPSNIVSMSTGRAGAMIRLQKLKDEFKKLDDMMKDEQGRDFDEQEDDTRLGWLREHGRVGLGKALSDWTKQQMEKYGEEAITRRWDLMDEIEDLESKIEFNLFRDDEEEDDDELNGFDAGHPSLEETIINGLMKLARENSNNVQLRIDAMKAIGGNLSKLRQAMAKQRAYDKETVMQVVRLARSIMENGSVDQLTRGEVKKLMSLIAGAAGKEDITTAAKKVVDLLVANQLRQVKGLLQKQLAIRGTKIDNKGVEVQGQLDIEGVRMARALKEGMSLTEEALAERIDDCLDRMGSTDDTISQTAAAEYQGYILAQQYVDEVRKSESEEANLMFEKKRAREDYDAGRLTKEQYNEFVESIDDTILNNQLERIRGYYDLLANIGDWFRGSIQRAKDFRDKEIAHVREIQHNANSDMEGRSYDEHHKPTWMEKAANWSFVRFFMKPLATFDQMLRLFGSKSVNGEGYLWSRFMNGYTEASDKEWRHLYQDYQELDKKVSEVFGKNMKWSDLFSIERKMPGMKVEFWDGGERKEHTLTPGNLLYIYMANKMADGRMKLRKMGITEDDINVIKEHLDPRFIELADWLQNEYLPEKRVYYNNVHEQLFGASMAAIDDYFPLVINKRDLSKEEEVGSEDYLGDDKIGATITGNIIKRTKNAKALDITNADAFDVILRHLQQMEHWAAYAAMNKDLGALLSYKHFRNQVLNMKTLQYGSGQNLWVNFKRACAVVSGAYRPKIDKDSVDTSLVNLAKGVTAAKISLRLFTALKQLLSYPAYLSEANPIELAKYTNPVGAVVAFNWAMENLPGFSKRWQCRIAGDTRLQDTDVDWGFWKNKIVKAASRIGMLPNAFIDAITVAMGAKAIYETKKKQYLNDGYSEEQAEQKALNAASISFNETQQSSEQAFISAMQLDRTVASVALTVFRNASMGYQRRLTAAMRNLQHMMTPGYKARSVEFMAKQMQREGLTEQQAERAANRAYNRSWYKNIADVVIFGYVMQLAWNLGPYLPYLIGGDDDDEKDKMLEDAMMHALAGGVEGLTGGAQMSEIYNLVRNGGDISSYQFNLLPLMSDLQQTLRHFKSDDVAAWNDVMNLLIQSGIGVNPQTLTDAFVAIMDAAEGDPETGKEIALLIMRITQMPQSSIDKMMIDELGMTGEEARKLDAEALARRWATYKRRKNAPLTGWAYRDEEEADVEKKYVDKFTKKIKERLADKSEDDLQQMMQNEPDEFMKELIQKQLNKMTEATMDEQTTYETETDFDRAENPQKRKLMARRISKATGASRDPYGDKSDSEYAQLYQELRTAEDVREDAELLKLQEDAKANGDYDKADEISKERKELRDNIRGMERGEDASNQQAMDDLRAERTTLLRKYGLR